MKNKLSPKKLTAAVTLIVLALMISFSQTSNAAPPCGKPKTGPCPTPTAGTEPTATPAVNPTTTPDTNPTITPDPSPTPDSSISVSSWVTKGDQSALLEQQSDLTFGADDTSGLVINVNSNHHYQEIDGFGAAITDSAAWTLSNDLSASQKADLMQDLFSPTNGIGISYVRVPVGASDFALDHYTYDETCCDLNDFSIARDQAYLIPTLLEAQALNANLSVMASPWSAPSWMKTTNSLYKGALAPSYYDEYADYLSRVINDYGAAGVTINSLTVQNEPQHTPSNYPGMWMSPNETVDFVGNHLGPALNGTGVEILALDHNWALAYYGIDVLNDPVANSYITGTAFHCYGGTPDFQSITRDAFPNKDIHFTECTSGEWANNWSNNLMWDGVNLLVGATRNWSQSVIKWNIALDSNHGPHTGGCTNCNGLVSIDPNSGAVTYNHDYYAIGHASKFVTPGAHRIASSNLEGSNIYTTAFENPDGSIVLILVNNERRNQTVKIRWNGQALQYSLPKYSITTLSWNGSSSSPISPNSPASLAATANDGEVNLTWTFSLMAESYNVYRSTSQGGNYSLIGSNVALPEFKDSSVSNGTTYYYAVAAVNGQGASALSDTTQATPSVPLPIDGTTRIEAESFNVQYGIGIENCGDRSGCGQSIGYTESGDYLGWSNVAFGAGASQISARVSSGSSGGLIEIRTGSPTGPLLGSVTVANTGGWDSWATISVPISAVSATQTIYLVFQGDPPETSDDGMMNLNWIEFN